MNVLTLSIKQVHFDAILEGTKKTESREIRPNTAQRYITYWVGKKEYKKYTDVPQDEEPEAKPIKYDAIQFYTGQMTGKRPGALVEVKKAEIEIIIDEEGNEIEYEYEGETYLAAQVVYKLGNVLERS
jgi:hypothetical protein